MPENVEVERKFLVSDTSFLDGLPCTILTQWYPIVGDEFSLRFRFTDAGALETTVKSRATLANHEWETILGLPSAVIVDLLRSASESGQVVKKRYASFAIEEPIGGHWVIDEFLARNAGLVVAEFELDRALTERSSIEEAERLVQAIELPSWCGTEVTRDRRYRNEYLAFHPYESWS